VEEVSGVQRDLHSLSGETGSAQGGLMDRLLAVKVSCWQAHVQADLGTVAAGADLDQIAQLMYYP
jgi:hypothetical protein